MCFVLSWSLSRSADWQKDKSANISRADLFSRKLVYLCRVVTGWITVKDGGHGRFLPSSRGKTEEAGFSVGYSWTTKTGQRWYVVILRGWISQTWHSSSRATDLNTHILLSILDLIIWEITATRMLFHCKKSSSAIWSNVAGHDVT